MTVSGAVGNRATRRLVGHRLTRLLNRETGEVCEVDEELARVKRMQRGVRGWSRVMQLVQRDLRLVMITLTFGDVGGWYPECISEYMDALSKHCGCALVGYAWVAEIQDGSDGGVGRGAVHYHVLVAVEPGTDVPMPDKSGMWSHGSSSIGTAWSVWYLLKYAQKVRQKGVGGGFAFPVGLRLYGLSRRQLRYIADELQTVARYMVRLAHLPVWVVRSCHSMDEVLAVTRARGGWLIAGHYVKTPWTVLGVEWVTK